MEYEMGFNLFYFITFFLNYNSWLYVQLEVLMMIRYVDKHDCINIADPVKRQKGFLIKTYRLKDGLLHWRK